MVREQVHRPHDCTRVDVQQALRHCFHFHPADVSSVHLLRRQIGRGHDIPINDYEFPHARSGQPLEKLGRAATSDRDDSRALQLVEVVGCAHAGKRFHVLERRARVGRDVSVDHD